MNESQELGELFTALAKAQSKMEVAINNSKNPFFKSSYADLSCIVSASRPYLAAEGLSVVQRVVPAEDGTLSLKTRLCHASGQWMESEMPINPPKPDIQTMGSYITYLRRYSYASIAGVVASNEDDDGEKAMEGPRQGVEQKVANPKITKPQLELLGQQLTNEADLLERILTGYKIAKLSDMLAKDYTKCINKIIEVKRAREQ